MPIVLTKQKCKNTTIMNIGYIGTSKANL